MTFIVRKVKELTAQQTTTVDNKIKYGHTSDEQMIRSLLGMAHSGLVTDKYAKCVEFKIPSKANQKRHSKKYWMEERERERECW